jgi:hypothetical protein
VNRKHSLAKASIQIDFPRNTPILEIKYPDFNQIRMKESELRPAESDLANLHMKPSSESFSRLHDGQHVSLR